MITAPAYMAVRFLRRFIGFFSHWYGGGTRAFWGRTVRLLAIFKNLFERPEKKGAASFLFWAFRALLGALAYLLITSVLFVLYVGWLLLPPYAFLKVLDGVVL